MALLQRTRVLNNQRVDKPDYDSIEAFVCADFDALHKYNWASANYILSGFVASGTGTTTLSTTLAGSSALFGLDNGTMFIGAPSLSALQTSTLTPSSTNYVELTIEQDSGGADSRAFWDQSAAGGEGGEFSQIVDTYVFLKASYEINISSFTGDADKIPLCEVVVDAGGVITSITDKRPLFFRLGRPADAAHAFSWTNGRDAENPLSPSYQDPDKHIKTLKDMFDALMDSIREIKGTTYWYEAPFTSLTTSFQNYALSTLSGINASAKFSWSGTQLSITDDSGTPLSTDTIGYLRIFNSTANLLLKRETIDLDDGDVLWLEIPNPLADTSFTGVGSSGTNYRVSARGAVALDEAVYWLAYREGTRIYLRGLGELEAGESQEIGDTISDALKTFLGFDPETATAVPYTEVPNSTYFANEFTTADSLVDAISANTANLNDLGASLAEHETETSTHGVTGDIVGTEGAQTLQEKTLEFLKTESEDVEISTAAITIAKGLARITGGGTSIDTISGIAAAGNSVVLLNDSGADITITNTDNIQTGTGTNFTLKNGAAAPLTYSGDLSKWVLAGGSAGGGLATSVKSASFTAAAGNHYLCDTSSGEFTATLPVGTSGALIRFSDDTRNWAISSLTIAPSSGESIGEMEADETLVCDLSGAFVQLAWDGTRWVIDTNGFATIAGSLPPGTYDPETGTWTFGDTTRGTLEHLFQSGANTYASIKSASNGIAGILLYNDSSQRFGIMNVGTAGANTLAVRNSSNADIAAVTDAGVWTFGPSSNTDAHSVYGRINISSSQSSAAARSTLENSGSAGAVIWTLNATAETYIDFQRIGVSKWLLYNNTSGDTFTWQASGTTVVGQLSQVGAWTLGATDTTSGHLVQGDAPTIFTAYSYATDASNVKRLIDARYVSDADCSNGHFFSCMNSSGNIIGSITAASNSSVAFNTTSDQRLKEDPTSFDGLSIVNALSPKEFTRKGSGRREKGLYAQEAYKVLPEIVNVGTDDLTESGDLQYPWGIDYSKLTPVLLRALQQQQDLINSLKARIEALESSNG